MAELNAKEKVHQAELAKIKWHQAHNQEIRDNKHAKKEEPKKVEVAPTNAPSPEADAAGKAK